MLSYQYISLLLVMQETFDKLPKWIDDIKEDVPPNVQLTLLGNKCDLRKEDGSDEGVDYMEAKVC